MQTTTPNQSRIRRMAGTALVALALGATALIGSPGDAAARDPLLQEVAEAAQRATEAGCGTEQPTHSRSSDSLLGKRIGVLAE
jgi:uncharacterized low-complexity protein